jgi:hypothetical protein
MGFSPKDVERLLVQTGRRCCIGKELHAVQVHHIIPIAEGGTDDIDNGIPLCPSCHDAVHSGGGVGRTTKKYTESELKAHRQATMDMISPRNAAAPSTTLSVLEVLRVVQDPSVSLSRGCVEGIDLARRLEDPGLEQLCRDELDGYRRLRSDKVVTHDKNGIASDHRSVPTYFSPKGSLTRESFVLGANHLFSHIKSHPDDFPQVPMIYPEPIAELEFQVAHLDQNSVVSISVAVSAFIGDPTAPGMISGYIHGGELPKLVGRIREVLTNRLLAHI